MLSTRSCFLALVLALAVLDAGRAEDPAPKHPPTEPAKTKPKKEPKNYDDVITKDAITSPGVIVTHRIDDKLYFELRPSLFERLLLWQAEVAKGPSGVSWGGMSLGSNVLRWERRGNKVYLWKVVFTKRANGTGRAVRSAVESANLDTIVAAFDIEAEGKDRSVVIHVTPLFTTDNADLPVRHAVRAAAGIDESRSYISEVKNFPTNVEIRSLLTFRGAPGHNDGPGHSMTALVHYSMALLPETPMEGRLFDSRVGYFTESFEKYDDPKTWVVNRQFITRFRLEKKDPSAAVSEPVKPIIFYLSREVPEKWRPYLKKGVEDWQHSFEAAGFKNAIICKEAPDRSEDPSWDPEDARWSVIRWVADPVQNAMGPHVHDPRSGEVISAHIVFWHDVIKLSQIWYFVQCAATDSRARKLPLPDELTGELLRYIAAHEVGHTLGLRHNHRASQAYTIQQLRDPAFTAKHGSVASIMSYGRFNYVAQPEDGVKRLIPVVAPYDVFAISWGYKPIAGAKSPEDERTTLDEWAARQLKEPWLRFGGEDGPSTVDPTVLTENISNDPIEATTLGLKNLDHVMDYLVAATTAKGEDFDLLEDVYKAMLAHERHWYSAVAKQVGGVMENRTLGGRGGETFVRVPKQKQRDAVQFLLSHAFVPPKRLMNPAVVSQFSYSGVSNDVLTLQKSLLLNLLSPSRMNRMYDAEVMDGDNAYTVVELVNDLQDGLWSELNTETPKVEPMRRGLQRAYLDILKAEFIPPAAKAEETAPRVTELRAVARVALRKLQMSIPDALRNVKDPATRAHLEDARSEIEAALTAQKK